jgi:hypothetical protein
VRALSIVAILGAAFGAFVASVTYWAMCESESGGSTMCPMGEPTLTMDAQRYGGYAGLLPAVAMVYLAFIGRRTAAKFALLIGILWWIGWAVLNDASIHGWDTDMTLL